MAGRMASKTSPSKKAKSRGKSRELLFKIHVITARIKKSELEKGERPQSLIRRKLIELISYGHDLPDGWEVELSWRNPPGPWRRDEWTSALNDSAQSSEGFSLALIGYIERLG